MEARLKFRSGNQKRFLLEVEQISNFSSDEIAHLVGVVGRSYRDWRREKLCMSLKAAEILCDKFKVQLPERKEDLVQNWIKYKSEKARVGGIIRYKKYGSFATVEGRKKGGVKTLAILRERGVIPQAKEFDFPKEYNDNLAEFVGIMLGDGGLTHGQASITLNSNADKEYIPFVINLVRNLFNFDAPVYERQDCNASSILCNGVKLIEYLLKIGLTVGNKVKQQARVPKWIFSKKCYRIACLRGLIETDGGIFIHRYKVNGKEYRYLKLNFSNRSVPLLQFVSKVLDELNMTPKIVRYGESNQVWLYNMREVYEYLRVVGTHNPRLLKNIGGVR